jgi:ABC-type multidrug transport system fused ATPase/permease subunit
MTETASPGADPRPGLGALFTRAPWAYFAGYYRVHWRAALVYGVVAAGQSLVFLPTLWLVRAAFDVAIPKGDIKLLLAIGAGLLGIRIANSAISLAVRAIAVRIVKDATFEMRRDLLETLYGLSRLFFVQMDADRLHTRILQDTERADTMANAILSAIQPAVLAGLCLSGALFWLNWRLTLLAACALPIVLFVSWITGRQVRARLEAFQRAFESFSLGVKFVLRHMDLTRAKGFEIEELAAQVATARTLRDTGARMAAGFALHGQITQSITGVAGLGLLIFGGLAIMNGTMTIGDFLVFYMAAGLLNGFVDRIGGALPDVLNGHAALLRLRAIRDSGPPVPYTGTIRTEFQDCLRLRAVRFDFAERAVLRDVSLEIRSGERIAIVGPNGSGKSTIINLILGFYAPAGGQIEAEGIDYRDIDIRGLRHSIGVVLQHPTFFPGTIAENIAYGSPDASPDAIARAARRARADAFIEALPLGFRTLLGDEGAMLSGGELQRIAIARALMNDPALLVLDEPTNHLDLTAIDDLMRGLARDPPRPALLIVSHDPAVVRYADAVYRIEDGTLVPEPARATATVA